MKYVIAIFLLCSCHEEKIFINKWDTYEIKKDSHFSGTHFSLFDKNEISFSAVFDNSSIYKTKNKNNQTDINKLFGFSDCNSEHQNNSARFGWVYNDSLSIYAYCYVNGKVKNKFITSIDIDKIYLYKIQRYGIKYKFYLAGKEIEMERNNIDGNGYLLFPYFGGTEKAPHNIKIKIKLT